MTTMGRDDPDMQMLWSPMSREGHARYAALRSAIARAYTPPPPSTAQQLRAKYAAGARRSGDAIFFETFGAPEQLLRADGDDDEAMLYAELFAAPTSAQPEPEPRVAAPQSTAKTSAFAAATAAAHVSRLAKPTRLPTPKRISLKRARTGESSAEKDHVVRKARFMLSDTTNIRHASTTTTTATMASPWDRHHLQQHKSQVLKPSMTANGAVVAKPFGASRFGATSHLHAEAPTPTATTAVFASSTVAPRATPTMDVAMSTSTRAFTLR